MQRTRTESQIFSPLEIDVTNTIEYVKELAKKKNEKISIFNVLLASMVRTIALRPQLNRFVSGTKIYQRNRIQLSFIVKKQLTEKATESTVKVTFSPYDTIFDVMDRVKEKIGEARSEDGSDGEKEIEKYASMPYFALRFISTTFRWLDKHNLKPKSEIDSDPTFCSAFITNMGSLKMEKAPDHHLFNWGNASLFISISAYTPRVKVINGEMVIRNILDFNVGIDDRISEGIYGMKAIKLMREYIKNPKILEEKPDIPKEIMDEHMFKEKYN